VKLVNMTTAAPRTNQAQSEAARTRILEAAVRALASSGYQGSSLASIAADAGLTTPGLLHHFPSKQALLMAVLADRDQQDAVRFSGGPQGLAVLDVLKELVAHNAQNPESLRAYTVLLGEGLAATHPARSWLEHRYLDFRERLARALEVGSSNGEVRADVDHDALAAEILAMMDGLQIQWVLNPHTIDLSGQFNTYLDRVRRGISPNHRGTGSN
jgi:AcrR family transcriptional regulator